MHINNNRYLSQFFPFIPPHFWHQKVPKYSKYLLNPIIWWQHVVNLSCLATDNYTTYTWLKNYLPRAFATKMSPNYIFNSLNMEVFHLGSIKSFVQIDENRSVNKKGERGYWVLGRHVPLKPVAADTSCPRYSTEELALETKSYICCMELFSWWFVWTKCKIVLQSVKTSRLTFI